MPYCRRTPLASGTFSSTRMTPTITPSTCSKRPSLAAAAALSISAASRSPTFGALLLRSSSASTSAAPGGSGTVAPGVAREAGARAASRFAAAGGLGAAGGGAGAGGGGSGGRDTDVVGARCGESARDVVRAGLVGKRLQQLEQLGGRQVRG